MIVRMHMSSPVFSVEPDISPRDAVGEMKRLGVRRLVVMENGALVGIVCYRDLTRAAEREGTKKRVSRLQEIMSAPVETIGPDEPLEQAARRMTRRHIGSLVVRDASGVVGIVTESDIFRALSDLLGGQGKAVRVTFDITNDDEVLDYLVGKSKELDLRLLSFLTYTERERLMAVALVKGDRTQRFVEKLWDSGQLVVNVVNLG